MSCSPSTISYDGCVSCEIGIKRILLLQRNLVSYDMKYSAQTYHISYILEPLKDYHDLLTCHWSTLKSFHCLSLPLQCDHSISSWTIREIEHILECSIINLKKFDNYISWKNKLRYVNICEYLQNLHITE